MDNIVERIKQFIEDYALKDYLMVRELVMNSKDENTLMNDRLRVLSIRLEAYTVLATNITDFKFEIDENDKLIIKPKSNRS